MGKRKKRTAVSLLLSVLISYAAAAVMLLIISFLMLKAGIGSGIISALIAATYVISTFVGGLFMGSLAERKKYLWGMLTAGIYVAVYLIVAVISERIGNADAADYVKRIVLMLLGGTLGGMLSR